LSVDSTDSELAFQAANAGLECARFTRRSEMTDIESGSSFTFSCFDEAEPASPLSLGLPLSGATANDDTFRYEAEITWGTAPRQRCSEIKMITMIIDATSPGVTMGSAGDPVSSEMPGYPSDTKFCGPGGRCTVVSVTGYSAACANKASQSTRSREILLEF
jgi:Tfp pilus assembly protein PilX